MPQGSGLKKRLLLKTTSNKTMVSNQFLMQKVVIPVSSSENVLGQSKGSKIICCHLKILGQKITNKRKMIVKKRKIA